VLARGAARRRPLAVRAALGASRLALVRPLLVETLLLVAAGGLVGAALAAPAGRALHAFLPASVLPLQLDVSPDWRVAAFAFAATLVAGLAFGAVPAWSASRVDVVESLKLDGRGSAPGRQSGRRAFLAAQVALSLVLLVGAGLFLRELKRARDLDPGFRIDGVGLVSVDMRLINRSPAASRTFFESWLERARAQPGVEAASLAGWLPLGWTRATTRVLVDGLLPPGPEGFPTAWNVVTPGFFDTLGIPLLAGRDFDLRDREGAAPVAIVSRATAARLFPGQDPLGQALRHEGRPMRVVGVVGDVVVERTSGREALLFYTPFAQSRAARMTLVLRASTAAPLEAARRGARALEPDAPVVAATSLGQHAATALFPQRLAAAVTGAFGIFGLLLASVGLYGMVAYFAAQRRRELAIRAALGARPWDLRRLVLVQGLRPVAAGVLAGLAGALGFARLAQALVPGMAGFDLAAFAVGALELVATAALAADLPARRAAARTPVSGLRAD
jgi:predicted permease